MKLITLFALAMILTGCNQPPEVIARDAIVGAKAALDTEKTKHPECVGSINTIPGQPSGICGALSKATGAKDVAIDALEAYCAGPDFNAGGVCNPPASGSSTATQALSKLNEAISNMNQTVADAKKAGGN